MDPLRCNITCLDGITEVQCYRASSYKIIFREAGNGKFKTYEEGLQCSKDIKAAGYVESSALLNEGIHNVSIGADIEASNL